MDAAFLRTMALCLEDVCYKRDKVPNSVIEEYWESHLPMTEGVLADYSLHPIMSYQEALMYAHRDVETAGSANVPYAVREEPLNVTSFIRYEDLLGQYNAQVWWERSERDHGWNAYVDH